MVAVAVAGEFGVGLIGLQEELRTKVVAVAALAGEFGVGLGLQEEFGLWLMTKVLAVAVAGENIMWLKGLQEKFGVWFIETHPLLRTKDDH